ncbi:hypothetical protein [Cedratvirus kamchatka]|uniref:Uncharacterized protein n=1 Tax=Cedratvirus kamchatka TaxID=2716914 RepID=A0A6G8MYJ2_9VIRU|nr:hypothetical protein [Cedratvirus kamchatka]WIL04776.1 hypothetical protein Cduv_296 [Cedratvirus duvanny]
MQDNSITERVMSSLRDLSESVEDPLLFSSWLNALLDYLPEDSPNKVWEKIREIIQSNMDRGMYRFYSEDLLPSEDKIKVWLEKI